MKARGNTALTPEESDTNSFGVVFTPRFAPGLAVTIDYFETASASIHRSAATCCLARLTAEWRHRLRTSWATPWDVDLSLTWRYYGSTVVLTAANVPLPTNRIDRELAAENYFDLAAN